MGSFARVLYGFPMKLVEDASLSMGLMHLDHWFNASLAVSYFPLLLLCHLQLVRLMCHPIGPSRPLIPPSAVMSSCFCELFFSRLFPFGFDRYPLFNFCF
jgi:hypothetical protein